MKNKIYNIFNKKKVIIGVIHFPPLLGYSEFPGFDIALSNALNDLKAFKKGGVDGIIIENNYDIPHKEVVSAKIVDIMISLGKKIREKTNLPLGVNVLWNDYKAALLIAKQIKAQFIRIPVFVDEVKTNCGIIIGDSNDVLNYRREINAENIALFTDIQVKHSELLNKRPIEKSALEAIDSGSDTLIVTGGWTGEAPDLNKLLTVRKNIGNFPIIVGSGANEKNVSKLLKYADGIIVSTSLKKGKVQAGEINVKSYNQRIDEDKVKELVRAISVLGNLVLF